MTRPVILILFVRLCFIEALRDDASCQLRCENGGVCEFLPGLPDDKDALARKVQAGQMIQRCSCPEGFTGTGCELPAQQCNMESMTCSNGSPCEKLSDDLHSCNCAVAEQISRFAARQCRIPYTEYCSDHYDPDQSLAFCTNGGKCKAGIIAAKISPGNTTINSKYQNAGCVCPPEYYGPHCEFLHQQRAVGSHFPAETAEPSASTKEPIDEETVPGNESIEDLINGYNGDNKPNDMDGQSGSNADSSSSSATLKILFSVLCIVMVGFLAVMMMVRRTRRMRALENAASKPDLDTRRKRSKRLKTVKVQKVGGVSKKGSFDMANDESTMKTMRTGTNSQSDHDDSLSGTGWVDALSSRLDSYVGHYIVDDDDDDDDDEADNLYLRKETNGWYPIDHGLRATYLVGGVDDDDDDIISAYSGRDALQVWNPTAWQNSEREIL